MKIFLDDKKTAPDGWVLVTCAEDLLKLYKEQQGKVTAVSFDVDLGPCQTSGFGAASWVHKLLVANPSWPIPEMYCHSDSWMGRVSFKGAIEDFYDDFKTQGRAIPELAESAHKYM